LLELKLGRFLWGLGVFLCLLMVLLGCSSQPPVSSTTISSTTISSKAISNYAIAQQSRLNQPGYYPLQQTLNPQYYQPVAAWQGRLILPPPDSRQPASDWVWLELWQAPAAAQAWLGQTLRLEWATTDPQLQTAVQAVTRDLQFSADAQTSQAQGNLHPTRLNGRQQVGPLQSLAGAHPVDDVVVSLTGVMLRANGNRPPTLQIRDEPTQVSGRYYTLVQILEPVSDHPPDLNGQRYWVQHYNRRTHRFDGAKEVVLMPQVLPRRDRIQRSTPQALQRSASGTMGWYLYGAENQTGMFVVQAIKPRSLVVLAPQQQHRGTWPGLHYLKQTQWQETSQHKGTLTTVQLDPPTSTLSPLGDWQLGDQALVLHLFGGIGGQKAEPNPIWGTITGHFSFGWVTVVREPLADELQFQVDYQQVYAHNPEGIIAGRISWPAYMGDVQRGWLGTRPVSDILVKFPPLLQDYQFLGLQFSPLKEFQRQLQLMTARYRIGDGTGAALVNPAQSCVQDSSQAVFITIARLEEQIQANPLVRDWLNRHPKAPETRRFQQLVQLRHVLERQLTPFRISRLDWQSNAESVAGVAAATDQAPGFWDQVLSWRTVFPRVAHDQFATAFFKQGASLRVWRTNQVGGWDASIAPLAPTQLLDAYGLPYLFSRLIEAVIAMPTWKDIGITLLSLAGYGILALSWGKRQGFLRWQPAYARTQDYLRLGVHTLFAPGLIEELLFRVWLIPHPTEAVSLFACLGWAALSLGIFVVYHPLNALTFYPAGRPTFMQAPFLILATGLGVVCMFVYTQTGLLWLITLVHWLVVYVWLGWLGGLRRLHPTSK
jgi:predicted Abi (CAAX) family protease